VKRFYQKAEAVRSADGWGISLDDRPVKTPARRALVAPARKLADAIAAEWAGQEKTVDPESMPLTGLANAAIDRVAADPRGFATDLAHYGETDLLCYRADSPAELVSRQCKAWDPLLDWAAGRFGVEFETTTGIVHRPQPQATVDRLTATIEQYDAFHLAALSPLVRLSGSLIAALALAERAFDEADVWTATQVDEEWQAQQWGADEEAIAARDAKRREFGAAMRFLRLLDS
jgi:chaperone required for assembly of F1-ATPase